MTPPGTDDESNHYTDLRELYTRLLDRHASLGERIDDITDDRLVAMLESERDVTLATAREVETLLNEWVDSPERDGPPGRDE